MPDASTIFELLAAAPRRRLLFLLCKTDSVDVPEGLVTRGATAQHSEGGKLQQTETNQVLETQLVHIHLPKLEAENLVTWDREEKTVTRGPAFDEIEPALRTLIANADTFPADLF